MSMVILSRASSLDLYALLSATITFGVREFNALVTPTIRLRLDLRSTPFDLNSTALRPFDDLSHNRKPTCMWAAA